MSYKSLVPQGRKYIEGNNDITNYISCGYNQALSDSKPLYEYCEKLESALKEIEDNHFECDGGEACEAHKIAKKAREE